MPKKAHTSITSGLPNYTAPPVNEVAIGFTFANLQNFKIPHFGLLWDRFRKHYPNTEHAAPLQSKEGIIVDSALGLPIPRVWFIDETETRLVQVQSNAFYFNWRNRKKDDEYPRFERISKAFRENVNFFTEFVKDLNLGSINPLECELTYINHIPKGQGWESLDDMPMVLNDFSWAPSPTRFLPKPINFAWHASFALPDNFGTLRVKLSEAKRRTDSHPLLVLELNARGLKNEKSLDSIWDWYSVAHEWIVRGFADITTTDIQQKRWGRDDSARS